MKVNPFLAPVSDAERIRQLEACIDHARGDIIDLVRIVEEVAPAEHVVLRSGALLSDVLVQFRNFYGIK